MKLFDMTGKTAVVTGSSRGIGLAIAHLLAEAGANVVVSSRKADACEAAVAEITAAGGKAVAVPANISRRADLENLIEKTHEHFGPVDAMICNAASNPYFGPSSGMGDEVFNKVMQNNVLSNHWLAQLVYPDMKAAGGGAIVIVSSIGGLKGSSEIGLYCISKAADMQLARNLAVEWGPDNIRINCIAPGLIKTDFAKALYEDPARKEAAEARYPLRRLGEPHDIAGAALLLASPAGAFMTGQTLVVDGGITVAG
ncbi:MAG: SDR family NAD(P)-dependent oxidoreductase [Burkholderiaceae bacterium]